MLEKAPLNPVAAEPAVLPLAKKVILAPATPLRSSSSLPLSSTEFVTVVRPAFVRRVVCTFALSFSDEGMLTIDCVSIVPGAFSAEPFAVHGVTTRAPDEAAGPRSDS